jgi:peptidyl-prolyl cis-trans isomerase A (cyclophilin A)
LRTTSALVLTLLPACASAPPADPAPTPLAASSDVVEVLPAPSATARTTATAAAPPKEHPALRDPSKARERAPEGFSVRFETTAGPLEFECQRKNAPIGVDRFYNLVKAGFFQDIAFFRVIKEPKPFVIQFGIHGDPSVSAVWRDASVPADPVVKTNTRGTLTFAQAGSPDSRTTQLFVNLGDNTNLDKMNFSPICEVTGDGMATLDRVNGQYGDQPSGQQSRIQRDGNAFLRSEFPSLDYIVSGAVLGP